MGNFVIPKTPPSPTVPAGGAAGQILAKINDVSFNTQWINNTDLVGFTLPTLTLGSVLFSNGTTIAQDNANFFWDDTNNRLGIGTTSPASKVHVGNAPTASANYGTLSIGGGAFNGSTSGYFIGSALGTSLAINEVSGYTGDLLNFQIAGVGLLKLNSYASGGQLSILGSGGTISLQSNNGSGFPGINAGSIYIGGGNGGMVYGRTYPTSSFYTNVSLATNGLTVLNANTVGALGNSTGTPAAGTVRAIIANGTDITASNLYLVGGLATGAGTTGDVVIRGANVGITGTTLATELDRVTFKSNGNVGIGTTTPTAKLQIQGSGATSATTNLLSQNSSLTTEFRVKDDGVVRIQTTANGYTTIGQNTTNGSSVIYAEAYSVQSGIAKFYNSNSASTAIFSMYNGSYAHTLEGYYSTAGAANTSVLGLLRTFAQTSGTSVDNMLAIVPTLNLTGTRSGSTVRGIYYNPTLTSLTGTTHRAIETVTGDVIFGSTSGNVGIGVNTLINTSAIVDITSTTKGFLPPRMTNAERLAIATPAIGLVVYCTDVVEGLYINKSTGWTFVV
jgi:hypothetical protein